MAKTRKIEKRTEPAEQEEAVAPDTTIEMVCISCGEKSVMSARQIVEKSRICNECEKGECIVIDCEACQGKEASLVPSVIKHFNDWRRKNAYHCLAVRS